MLIIPSKERDIESSRFEFTLRTWKSLECLLMKAIPASPLDSCSKNRIRGLCELYQTLSLSGLGPTGRSHIDLSRRHIDLSDLHQQFRQF